MAKFLIEVPHNEDQAACLRALEVFVSSGNHFLANAEWGARTASKLFQITHEDVKRYKEKHKLESTEDFHS